MVENLESCSPQKPTHNTSEKFKLDLQKARAISNRSINVDTLRKYCLGFKRYTLYVQTHVKNGAPVTIEDLIPAQPDIVRAFLANIAQETDSYSQITAAKTALSYFHRRAGQAHAMEHDFIRVFMKGAEKTLRKPAERARCPTDEEVNVWLTIVPTNFKETRVQAIIAIMLGSGIRHDSVLSLTPHDLQKFIGELTTLDHDAPIPYTVDQIKTDRFRNTHLKQLVGSHFIKPVRKYLEIIGFLKCEDLDNFTAATSVFRAAQHTKNGTRLVRIKITETEIRNATPVSKSTTQKDFKAFQQRYTPGLKPTTLHSARAKFASALDKAGAGQLFVQRLGQWSSDCFLRQLDSPTQEDAGQLRKLHETSFST